MPILAKRKQRLIFKKRKPTVNQQTVSTTPGKTCLGGTNRRAKRRSQWGAGMRRKEMSLQGSNRWQLVWVPSNCHCSIKLPPLYGQRLLGAAWQAESKKYQFASGLQPLTRTFPFCIPASRSCSRPRISMHTKVLPIARSNQPWIWVSSYDYCHLG